MRSSIALIALSLAGFGALGCVRETVSCADNPSAVCPDVDTGTPGIDASTDAASGTDANTDAFSVFDAWAPDAGTDAFMPDAFIVPDATMCNPACSGARDICISMNVCGECQSDADCDGATPACNMATNTCVPCTATNVTGCPDATSACTDDNRCVACTPTNAGACTAAGLVCNPADNTCVQCNSTTDCGGRPSTPVCNTSTRMCVPCAGLETGVCTGTTPACDTDNTCTCTSMSCASATAARCDVASNACAACTVDTECSNVAFPNNRRCVDFGGGAPRECRQCNVATETMDCPGGDSCNPITHRCTGTPRRSRQQCQSCVADSECSSTPTASAPAGLTCAQPTHRVGSNSYCVPIRSGACSRPFGGGATVTTASGAAGTMICEHRTATCEAFLAHGSQPTGCEGSGAGSRSDAACGVPATDGLCRVNSGGNNYCTVSCVLGSNNDCPAGVSCIADAAVPTFAARCSVL